MPPDVVTHNHQTERVVDDIGTTGIVKVKTLLSARALPSLFIKALMASKHAPSAG
jgi:hypothetical protein